jgi:hypothetical protein
MPVYKFVCEKHGEFEKMKIIAEWDKIICQKYGKKSKVDEKVQQAQKSIL